MRTMILGGVIWALCASAMATPGAVDADGCHESKKAGFHCHPERATKAPGGETTRDRERRLKRECKGRPNAGACAGYGG